MNWSKFAAEAAARGEGLLPELEQALRRQQASGATQTFNVIALSDRPEFATNASGPVVPRSLNDADLTNVVALSTGATPVRDGAAAGDARTVNGDQDECLA